MSFSQVASLTVKTSASYYVATTGSDSAAGSLARSWKTISHAVKTAPAGATIYVKAGVYADSVAFTKDGQSLIGYKTAPGDQPLIMSSAATATTQGITYPPFDGVEMPLIKGANRSRGTGMSLRGRKNITVKNVAISNFSNGLIAGNPSQNFAENHTLFNVNISTIGDPSSSYSGLGISLGSMGTQFSSKNTITHSLIINAAAEGLTMCGDDNVADGVKVFLDDPEDPSGTDYYVLVCGDRNLVKNSLIYRKLGSGHSGHGFSIKSTAEHVLDSRGAPVAMVNSRYNLFENNTAINLGSGFVVRHRGVRFNTFRDHFAYGPYTGYGGCDQGNGIFIRDGASDNVFINTTIENTCNAIIFNDTTEDGDRGPNPPGHPGNNNIIDGAHVTNSRIGVYFFRYDVPSDAGANIIRNSSFTLTRYMLTADRHATRMKYINVSFSGTAKMSPRPGGYFWGGTHAADVLPSQFIDCAFSDIEGGPPKGF